MAKLPKNKTKSAPPLKGQGKSLSSMKPERSGGFGSPPIAKTATNQKYGAGVNNKSKGSKK